MYHRLFSTLCFIVCVHYTIINAVDVLHEFQEKLKTEQIDFLTRNLRDIDDVKNLISTMYQLDQECRSVYIHDRKNQDLVNFMVEMDRIHTEKIKEILACHGWLTIDTFGKETDHQTWLLVQHADRDQAFQKQCLYLLTDVYQKGQTDKKNYAYLYDRVALVSEELGLKQKYGTQYCMFDDGTISLRPHEGTIEELNLRRNEVGLCPLEEYFQRIQNMYKK